MEYLDLYNDRAGKLDKTILRGSSIRQGEYSMSVHLFIYDHKGRFLLQKRSMKKRSMPGVWSVTCGAVSKGEDSLEAGIREAKEEINIDLSSELLEPIARIKRRRSMVDIYFVKYNFDLARCILQKEEVDAVKLGTAGELLAMIRKNENRDSSYLLAIKRALKRRKLL